MNALRASTPLPLIGGQGATEDPSLGIGEDITDKHADGPNSSRIDSTAGSKCVNQFDRRSPNNL
jgi:hypothetical protein